MAKTIKYVLDHPVSAFEMGMKAREKCKREYSWGMMGETLVTLFQNIVIR
jgi:glycosyltransferase involved in cell wall biosynthesis